jgi:predicted alpha/beta-fold hydrolase
MALAGILLFGIGCAMSPGYQSKAVPAVRDGQRLPVREYADVLSRELDQKPRPFPPFLASLVYEFPWVGTFRDGRPESAGMKGGYDRVGAFETVSLPVEDGLELGGRISVVEGSRPWVILVHGALRSGAQKHLVEQAEAIQAAGFAVLSLDMREHGLSWKKTAFQSSLGWREGLDLVRAAEWLRETRNAKTVSIVGTSLGGRYALRAAIETSSVETSPIDAVMAVVPAAHLPEAARDLEESTRTPFGINALIWKNTLQSRDKQSAAIRGEKPHRGWTATWPLDAGDVIRDYIEHVIVPRWDFESVEAWKKKANPVEGLDEVNIPVLVYAVRDDPFVKVWQSEEVLRSAAEGNPDIGFVFAERGGHTAFAIVDPNFFYNVTVNFLEAYGKPGTDDTPERGGNRTAGEDVST